MTSPASGRNLRTCRTAEVKHFAKPVVQWKESVREARWARNRRDTVSHLSGTNVGSVASARHLTTKVYCSCPVTPWRFYQLEAMLVVHQVPQTTVREQIQEVSLAVTLPNPDLSRCPRRCRSKGRWSSSARLLGERERERVETLKTFLESTMLHSQAFDPQACQNK